MQFDLEPTISGAENAAAAAGDLRVPVRDILAHALAVSDHGRSFTTRSAVQFSGRATADDVMSVLFDQKGTGPEAAWRAEMQQLAAAIVEEQAELDAVLATGRALAGESEYARNVRALVDLEFCDLRHVALIASLVKIHYNELTRRAQKASWAPDFLAPVEDKIVGVVATVTTVKVVEGYYGPKTLIIFQTVDGHAIKWFATGGGDVNLGETYTVAGRVKAHEVFNDVDQTVITRAKLTPESRATNGQPAPSPSGGAPPTHGRHRGERAPVAAEPTRIPRSGYGPRADPAGCGPALATLSSNFRSTT